MRPHHTYMANFAASLLSVEVAQGKNITVETRLNITALASRNGFSVLECWQLASTGSYAMSATNWVASGNLTHAVYSIIEPRTTPGEAWAPAVQSVSCKLPQMTAKILITLLQTDYDSQRTHSHYDSVRSPAFK